MKKIKYIFLSLIAAGFATGCDTNDDAFYNETYVEIPNLIQVETQPDYVVGERLYVNASFSRYVGEPGETTLLDIYRTTDGALSFDFSYALEKKIGTEWQVVSLPTSELDVQAGEVNNVTILYASAVYNSASETYHSRVGIPLESAGEYRLSFNSDLDTPHQAELRSRSEGNHLKLNISSEVSQLGADGFYNFTVN